MLMQPPHIGDYHATRPLGIGGTAEVWEARGPHGLVALKVARDEQQARVVAAESGLLRRASHPHIARLLDAGDGWIVTELVRGLPLDRWAIGRDLDDILGVCLELIGAVRHLHHQGVVHGDIKPANALVDEMGHLKLLDPGGRRRRGTPGFVAPEVLDGARPNEATDLYSLGATLYAAITGHGAYDVADPAALRHLPHVALPITPRAWRADLSTKLARLVLGLMSRDPSHRPSLTEVQHLFTRFHRLPSVPPAPGMVRARRALGEAVAKASAGESVMVLLYGPTGSGRRTLAREAMGLAELDGMTFMRRATPAELVTAVHEGKRPCTITRIGPAGSVAFARQALEMSGSCLVIGYGPLPVPPLARAGAVHIAPDALTRDDARAIGQWLGVADVGRIDEVWRAARGLPRAIWIGLEPHASRNTENRRMFSLPGTTARVVTAIHKAGESIHITDLAEQVDLPMPMLVDQLELLLATGRVTSSDDGLTIRMAKGPKGGGR